MRAISLRIKKTEKGLILLKTKPIKDNSRVGTSGVKVSYLTETETSTQGTSSKTRRKVRAECILRQQRSSTRENSATTKSMGGAKLITAMAIPFRERWSKTKRPEEASTSTRRRTKSRRVCGKWTCDRANS